jgi:glycosyltransferase involved in cell wall biosynthesis
MNANTQNAHIVPHGSFVGLYPNTASKLESRKHLGIDQKKFTFLFFGMIREYKGIDTLLEVFPEILKAHPGTQLIIAGACNDNKLRQKIENAQEMYKNSIYTRLEQIPDEEIQYYFNAADIAVFPFKRITTSGSVLLALSFGVPVIYPLLGNMKEIPENAGISYDSSNKLGLKGSMQQALANKREVIHMVANGLVYAETLSWERIAKLHYGLYMTGIE